MSNDGNHSGCSGALTAQKLKERIHELEQKGRSRMNDWNDLMVKTAVEDLPPELHTEFEKKMSTLMEQWITLWKDISQARVPMRMQKKLERKLSQRIVNAPFFIHDGVRLCNAGVGEGLGSAAMSTALTIIDTSCREERKGEYAKNEVWCKRSLFPSLRALAFRGA